MERFVAVKNLALVTKLLIFAFLIFTTHLKRCLKKENFNLKWRAESTHFARYGNVLKEALAQFPCFVGQ